METQPRGRGRPVTTGTTKKRDIRVGDVWDEVKTLAKERTGEDMPDVVKRLLAVEARRLRRLPVRETVAQ